MRLLLIEHLLRVLPYDIRTWVKEHEPANGKAAANLAMQYMNARAGGLMGHTFSSRGFKDNQDKKGNPVGVASTSKVPTNSSTMDSVGFYCQQPDVVECVFQACRWRCVVVGLV